MLSQAGERVTANEWRNVTLIESAIEDAAIPEVADAAVFVLTHDVMRSSEALSNALAHVRPGGGSPRPAASVRPRGCFRQTFTWATRCAGTRPPWTASIAPGACWRHSCRTSKSSC